MQGTEIHPGHHRRLGSAGGFARCLVHGIGKHVEQRIHPLGTCQHRVGDLDG